MNICLFCQRALKASTSINFLFSLRREKNNQLCGKCKEIFNRIHSKNRCLGCSKNQEMSNYCVECLKWKEEYPNLTLNHKAVFVHNEKVKELMDQFKRQGDLLLADLFSEEIKLALTPYMKTHLILAVPKSQPIMKSLGYNPVEVLLDRAGIKYYSILETELWMKESKKKVLLVDDIYKTGKTILRFRAFLEENIEEIDETMSFSLFR